jgi:hypothetical protein
MITTAEYNGFLSDLEKFQDLKASQDDAPAKFWHGSARRLHTEFKANGFESAKLGKDKVRIALEKLLEGNHPDWFGQPKHHFEFFLSLNGDPIPEHYHGGLFISDLPTVSKEVKEILRKPISDYKVKGLYQYFSAYFAKQGEVDA